MCRLQVDQPANLLLEQEHFGVKPLIIKIIKNQKKTIKMKKGVPQQSQTPNQDFVVFGTDASLCVQPQEELYEAAPSYVAKAISLEWRPPGSRYEI